MSQILGRDENEINNTGFGVTTCFLKVRVRRAPDLTGTGTSTGTIIRFCFFYSGQKLIQILYLPKLAPNWAKFAILN